MKKQKPTENNKTSLCITRIILFFFILTASILAVFQLCTPRNSFRKEPFAPIAEHNGLVITPSDESIVAASGAKMQLNVSPVSSETTCVSASKRVNAPNGIYTITAVVLDHTGSAIASPQSVHWTLSWNGTNGGDLATFMKLTTNGCKATLQNIKAFSVPILLTCASAVDAGISASVRLDYRLKDLDGLSGKDIKLTLHGMDFFPLEHSFSYHNMAKYGECKVFPQLVSNRNETAALSISAPCTIVDTIKFEIVPKDSYKRMLEKRGLKTDNVLSYTITFEKGKSFRIENFFDKKWAQNLIGEEPTGSNSMPLRDVDGGALDEGSIGAYCMNCYVGDLAKPVCTYNFILDFWQAWGSENGKK